LSPNIILVKKDKQMSEFNYHVKQFQSPGYLLIEVPSDVRKELEETIEVLHKTSESDARRTLRGHLDQEWHLPIGMEMKLLTKKLSNLYLQHFGMHPSMGVAETMRDMSKVDFDLEKLWINYQKKYDFNPLHIHSGVFSFVIWVNIPYDLQEERKRYVTNGNETASFIFQYMNAIGGLDTEHLFIDKSFEWKMVFFPARLNHAVNPFYTSDDHRISISGNVYLNDK
jgi:hypothetical protein